jgi:GNAT superfamily N-acetyltransferase
MEYIEINNQIREQVNSFIAEQWLSTDMIIRGTIIDMTTVKGIAAMENSNIIGLITFVIYDDVCEITSLDSIEEGKGIGTSLIDKLICIAKENGCGKVIVVTTNDNINAIRFYQKRGFDMAKLYHNSLVAARKLKPSIPLLGDDGIPLMHEIEFEMNL